MDVTEMLRRQATPHGKCPDCDGKKKDRNGDDCNMCGGTGQI